MIPPSEPSPPALGSVLLGKLRLDRVLGRGGMGTVYQAQHLKLDEAVAVKILQPDLVRDQVCVERFLREARASARIAHPNCIQVRDVDQLEDGTPFMVMELLQGESLFERMKRGPLSLTETLAIMEPACAALGAAHRLGIVHRDFKPGNIQISEKDGVQLVKVLDFGISKVPTRTASVLLPRLTDPVRMLGSPKYMAPEQMASPGEVGPEADVWAIGVILYRALTGVSPFEGANVMDICHAVLQAEPVDPREIDPWIPDWIADLITRCLNKNPGERPPDAGAVHASLKREGGFFPVEATETMEKSALRSKMRHVRTVQLAAVQPQSASGSGFTVPNATVPNATTPRAPFPSVHPASLSGSERAPFPSVHPSGPPLAAGPTFAMKTEPILRTSTARGKQRTLVALVVIAVLICVAIGIVLATVLLQRSSSRGETGELDESRPARTASSEKTKPLDLAAVRARFERESFKLESLTNNEHADALSMRRGPCWIVVSALNLPAASVPRANELKMGDGQSSIVLVVGGRAVSFFVSTGRDRDRDPPPAWCSIDALRPILESSAR